MTNTEILMDIIFWVMFLLLFFTGVATGKWHYRKLKALEMSKFEIHDRIASAYGRISKVESDIRNIQNMLAGIHGATRDPESFLGDKTQSSTCATSHQSTQRVF